MKVSRVLFWSSVGRLASNEAVVELIQACLRVCFEKVLSELLRKCAELALADMILVLFSRLDSMVDSSEAADMHLSTLSLKGAQQNGDAPGDGVLFT